MEFRRKDIIYVLDDMKCTKRNGSSYTSADIQKATIKLGITGKREAFEYGDGDTGYRAVYSKEEAERIVDYFYNKENYKKQKNSKINDNGEEKLFDTEAIAKKLRSLGYKTKNGNKIDSQNVRGVILYHGIKYSKHKSKILVNEDNYKRVINIFSEYRINQIDNSKDPEETKTNINELKELTKRIEVLEEQYKQLQSLYEQVKPKKSFWRR